MNELLVNLFSLQSYQKMTYGARLLYICMKIEAGDRVEFEFPQSLAVTYGFASNSFERHKKELLKSGYIDLYIGGKGAPNVYKFATLSNKEKEND